jgi:hypothetical protein
MRAFLSVLLLCFAPENPQASPVGRFRLTTVDGVRVPMVWRQGDAGEGGAIQLHWISGQAVVRRDGSFELTLIAMRSGRGLSGSPEPVVQRGRWRLLAGPRFELSFDRGWTVQWGITGGFAQMTLQIRYPDLEGQARLATLVLVREE